MIYSDYQTLSVSVSSGVGTVTFDNGPINLTDLAMFIEIDRVGRQLEGDPEVRVVILQSANPDFFIAHADINLLLNLPAEPEPREELLWVCQGALDRFRTMSKATIAKIAGRCRGVGNELAIACDMRFAALGKAVFAQPEVGGGVIPGGGGSTRLPRLIGRGRALEIILGSGDFTADEADRYGMINRALPAEELDAFVADLAGRIAGFPAEAIAAAKVAVSADTVSIEDSLLREEVVFYQIANSAMGKQRMTKALEHGLQTKEVEMQSFTEFWAAMA